MCLPLPADSRLCNLYFFQTHDNREHLAMMERILGPVPSRMIRKTRWENLQTLHTHQSKSAHEQTFIQNTVLPELSQKAEVFLSRPSGLGRELLCWEIRERKLQTLAGKRWPKYSVLVQFSSWVSQHYSLLFLLSAISGTCCRRRRSTTSCLTSLKACWSTSPPRGWCSPTHSSTPSLTTGRLARRQAAKTGRAIVTSAGDPRASKDWPGRSILLYMEKVNCQPKQSCWSFLLFVIKAWTP